MIIKGLICLALGYLTGCFSISYFISKAKGFDIRDKGSHNAGASNMALILGMKYGVITALVDILKAFLIYYLCLYLFKDVRLAKLAGAAAVIGHMFPFYMGFRGGKGFACFIGLIYAVSFKLGLFETLIIAIMVLSTKYMVAGTFSMTTTSCLYFFIVKDFYFAFILLILVIIIFYKHKQNIINLKNGDEPKITDAKK